MNWTQAKFESFVKSALRAASRRWPPKYEVLNAAKCGKKVNQSSGRLAEHYKCAECSNAFPLKLVVVDHIEPVVPITGFVSWDNVILRMYCPVEGLQVLCKECHKIKTKQENEERKLHKNKKRKSNEES